MWSNTTLLILAAPVLLYWFVRLEQRGRPEVAVFLLLALLVVEALIYPSQNEVPGGLFHPSIAGRAIRLPEYIIPLALLARVMVRGAPMRIGNTAIAWLAFFAWYGFGALVGLLFHHSFDQIFFQSKSVVFVGGAALLVGGVPVHRLVTPRRMRRLLIGLGGIVGIIAPAAVAKTGFALHIPRLPGSSIGLISPDAATILATVALIGLLFEATRRRRLLVAGLAAIPMFLTPFVATQRAAILGLAVMLGAVGFGMAAPTWRRRIRGTPTEGVLLLAILLIPVLSTISIRAMSQSSGNTSLVPFADVVTETFVAQRKAQSADTRRNLWREGLTQFREYPAMGWGLGKTYEVAQAGRPNESLVGGGFHNIAVDLLVRRGVVGLVLFAVAMTLTLSDAFLAWRRSANRYIAVFGFACGTALVGLLAKGMVESLFEKFRLATLMGLLIGAIITAASATKAQASLPDDEREDKGRLVPA